jgi:hypothetical protein
MRPAAELGRRPQFLTAPLRLAAENVLIAVLNRVVFTQEDLELVYCFHGLNFSINLATSAKRSEMCLSCDCDSRRTTLPLCCDFRRPRHPTAKMPQIQNGGEVAGRNARGSSPPVPSLAPTSPITPRRGLVRVALSAMESEAEAERVARGAGPSLPPT